MTQSIKFLSKIENLKAGDISVHHAQVPCEVEQDISVVHLENISNGQETVLGYLTSEVITVVGFADGDDIS